MPPTVEDRFQDILRSASKIEKLVEGRGFDDFLSDDMRHLAIERLLQIICEAALKLPDSVKQLAPHIDWRDMNNFANLLRHAYHATDAKKVWSIVQDDIPHLKSFIEQRLREGGK